MTRERILDLLAYHLPRSELNSATNFAEALLAAAGEPDKPDADWERQVEKVWEWIQKRIKTSADDPKHSATLPADLKSALTESIAKEWEETAHELEKLLADANRGAQRNAIVNQGLAKQLIDLQADPRLKIDVGALEETRDNLRKYWATGWAADRIDSALKGAKP